MAKKFIGLFLLFLLPLLAHPLVGKPLDDVNIEETAQGSGGEGPKAVPSTMTGTVAPGQGEEQPKKEPNAGQETKGQWGVVRVASALNYRKSPWGQILGQFSNGEKVEVIGEEGDWYKVKAHGKVGYAHKNYIKLTNDGGADKPDSQGNGPSGETEPASPAGEGGGTPGGQAEATADGGVEVKGVPVFCQNKTDPYDPAGGRGKYPACYCGPTSLQMVLSFNGVKKSRDYLALTKISGSPMYIRGQGSAYGPMVAMAKHLGFGGTEQVWGKSISKLRERCAAGRPQIISVGGTVRDTSGRSYHTNGHIMAVVGVTGGGDVIVHDPAGTGLRKVIRARDFLNIWRGFSIDIKK